MRSAWLVVVLTIGSAGCAPVSTFGQATRVALRAQTIDPEAGSKKTPDEGLNPEEAAIVSESYRRSLSPSRTERAARGTPVVIM